MTKYLTVDEILTLHSIIKEQFHENTTSGKIDRNKIQSIIDKPKREIAGQEIYTTIYEKAACLLEAFCREHIFADGNKRIAVLAMFTFLTFNKYNIALPLSTVKYTVEVTKHLEQKPEEIEALIKDISKWIEKRSSTNNRDYKKKLIRYVVLPLFGLAVLQFTIVGIPIQYLVVQDWFQTKTHPQYKYDARLIIGFFLITLSKLRQNIKQQES